MKRTRLKKESSGAKKKRLKNIAGSSKKLELSSGQNVLVSYSDVMRWNSDYQIGNKVYKLSSLVELGKKSNDVRTVSLAKQMEGDLKSKTGLLIGFPIVMLVDRLKEQRILK